MIAIGIDIGGTFVKFFAVDQKGKILKKDKVPTYNTLTANGFLTHLADIVNEWKKELKTKNIVLGVGLPGDTDHVKGVLRWAPNIPWRNLKVKETLTKKTGCECFVSNDANMAAWGVHAKELGAKYNDLIIVTLGTGIGGGVIAGGKLYQGYTGSAGELGHMKIDFSPEAPLCGCGMRGCLEAYAGTIGIKREAEKAAVKYPKSDLAYLLKTEDFSVNLLSIAAAKGDKVALDLWENIGLRLGQGIANMVLLLNPQAIVLAGGVSRGSKYFMASIKQVFEKQSVKTPFKKIKILLSKEGNIGGVGAAMYALSKINEK